MSAIAPSISSVTFESLKGFSRARLGRSGSDRSCGRCWQYDAHRDKSDIAQSYMRTLETALNAACQLAERLTSYQLVPSLTSDRTSFCVGAKSPLRFKVVPLSRTGCGLAFVKIRRTTLPAR